MRHLLSVACALSLGGCIYETSLPGETGTDRTPPRLSAFDVSATHARIGQELSFQFTSDEVLPPEHAGAPNPRVTFGGQQASCVEDASVHACTLAVVASMGEGPHGFGIEAFDQAGNATGELSAPFTVTLDFTPPTLSVTAGPNPAPLGQAVTFVINASEPLGAQPELQVDFLSPGSVVACSGTVPGQTFSCSGGTVDPGATEGDRVFTATGVDQAGKTGTSAPAAITLREPAGLPPVVNFESVLPAVVRDGGSMTITFGANTGVSSCTATVGAKRASCAAPAGTRCTCVTSATEETGSGVVGIIVTASNANGTGTDADADGVVQIDRQPPTLATGKVHLVRNPVGTEDQLVVDPGGVLDLTDDDVPYGPEAGTRARVVEVRLLESSSGSPLLTRSVEEADDSVAATPIAGTASSALGRYWLELVDVAGNVGVVELTSGRDISGPTVSAGALAVVRRPLGQVDGITAAAGAISDPGCVPASVQLYETASGAQVDQATPATDGSFPEVAWGSATAAPPRAYVAATDKCGNASARVEVTAGADLTGPAVSGSALRFVRRSVLEPDAFEGDPGAIQDPGCAPERVELYPQAPSGGGAPQGALVAQDAVAASGSFGPVDFGTATASLPRAWAFGFDKCGNRGAGVEVEGGKDTEPPTFDPLALTFVRRPRGTEDKVAGGAGAVADAVTQVVGLRAYDLAGAQLGTELVPAVDGSFAPRSLGETDVAAIRVEATDKAGNVSARVAPRQVDAVFNLAGKTPYSEAVSPLAAVSLASELDPLGAGPGHLASRAPEPSDYVALAVEDGVTLSTVAVEEESTETGPWWRTSLVPMPDSAVVYDSARGRLVMSSRGETWAYESEGWERLRVAGPPSVEGPALAYDPVRDRVVLYVGNDDDLGTPETWEFDGSSWTQVVTSSAPGLRVEAAMAYDASLGQVVLFGGRDKLGRLGDTWCYDGLDWSTCGALGTPPTPRAGARMVYDPDRGALVLFGGQDAAGVSDETFTFSADAWTPLATSGMPPARRFASLAHDGARGRLVLFGGSGAAALGDHWELEGTTWTERILSPRPTPRMLAPMTYHPGIGELVLTSGTPSTGYLREVWTFDGTEWTNRTPLHAGSYTDDALGMDLRRDRLVWLRSQGSGGRLRELAGVRWTELPPPAPVENGRCAFDARRGQLLYQGGSYGSGQPSNQTRSWDGVQLSTYAPGPPAGVLPVAYDAGRDRVVALAVGAGGAETWEWNGSWTNRATATLPLPRTLPAIAYDSRRQRIVVFGGRNALNTNQVLSDVWEYDGVDWLERTFPMVPSPRDGAKLVEDPLTGKLLLMGGRDLVRYQDVWEYDGTAWTPSTLPALPEAANFDVVADPAGSRLYALFWTSSAHSTYELPRLEPHSRHAAQAFRLPLEPGASVGLLSSRFVGHASGSGGAGVELYVWKGTGPSAGWELLGSHAVATPSFIDAAVSGAPPEYPLAGQLWLLAVAGTPSASGVESTLDTDYLEVRVQYTLP